MNLNDPHNKKIKQFDIMTSVYYLLKLFLGSSCEEQHFTRSFKLPVRIASLLPYFASLLS